MLYDEITQLIATHREDDWWDFKREHHHDKAELVHDILCMANNRPRRDSYIIFGVEDNTFSTYRFADIPDQEERGKYLKDE